MMRYLFLLITFTTLFLGARADEQPQDLKLLRKKLVRAIDDSHVTDSLYMVLDAQHNKTPLTMAYLGAWMP